MKTDISTARDKPLFTPGPLTTSGQVKQAMLRDLGSRDTEFIAAVQEVRDGLLQVAGVSKAGGYEAVLMQGSGTFTIESVLSSAIPPGGKLIAIVNGAYGKRIVQTASRHGIEVVEVESAEDVTPDLGAVQAALDKHSDADMVVVVHCETTSGIMNPIDEIGKLVANHRATYFVDSMSAFGAVSFDFAACGIDFLVSSANKCIEGVPGFAFAICRREALLATEGMARTLSLDMLAQWQGLERNGQFRFTPPDPHDSGFSAGAARIGRGGWRSRAGRTISAESRIAAAGDARDGLRGIRRARAAGAHHHVVPFS